MKFFLKYFFSANDLIAVAERWHEISIYFDNKRYEESSDK